MVNNDDNLNLIFRALADPTRRQIVETLVRNSRPLAAGELSQPFNISLPAMTKHLKYLESCRLITRTRSGRSHFFTANRSTLEEISWWLAEQQHFWNNPAKSHNTET
jgi:DNA-binding transcriptional ArsR family regulator